MKKATKFAAIALASSLALTGITTGAANAAPCPKKADVTFLGTIKPEITDQFLSAVKTYNKSQTCYTVSSLPGDRKLTFLQNVTPLYAAKRAPTIMYDLQFLPDMADRVMDWKGTKLAAAAPKDLLAISTIGGKIVGVPSTVEAFGLVYNKKVLDKAGVDPKKITTRAELEAAFKKVKASGTGAVRFAGIWWSLGAHVTNKYFTNSATTHEGRLKTLDAMADGTKKLASDPVFKNYLATFELMKKYNSRKPAIAAADPEYASAASDLASGKAGFWFMGNWSEGDLEAANKSNDYGIMPLPISNDAKAYGNNSISVGAPGYFMIDNEQSTPEQRAGAIDFLTWLYLSPVGQKLVSGEEAFNGFNFIPIYKGVTAKATTFMARDISSYVQAGKTLEWMNAYYPGGGQELYGASGQKLITDVITGNQYAAELEAAWKGSVKTWRGVKK